MNDPYVQTCVPDKAGKYLINVEGKSNKVFSSVWIMRV